MPRKSIKTATAIYMRPIFLGSSEVKYSRQSHPQSLKYVSAMTTATPPHTIKMTPPSATGSCGIASKESLPKKVVLVMHFHWVTCAVFLNDAVKETAHHVAI